MESRDRDTEEFDRAEPGEGPEVQEEADEFGPGERPAAVADSARRRDPADETATFEQVSSRPIPEEEDPLGESAAAAWAAGATPPADAIPDDEDRSPGSSRDSETEIEPPPVEVAADSETEIEPPPVEVAADSETEIEPPPVEMTADSEAEPGAADSDVDQGAASPTGFSVEQEPAGYQSFSDGDEDPLAYPEVEADDETFSAPPEGGAELAPAPRGDELVTERGRTTISDNVVEKIAGKAASEVEGVGGVRSYGLSRLTSLFSSDEDGRKTKADAEVDSATTHVDLAISIRYPEPVGDTAELVRDHVRARVQELTGLEVAEINITVPELVPPPPPKPQPRVE